MKHIQTATKRASFTVLQSTRSAQAAKMVLQPGESPGEPQNEHPQSEPWLFVISGTGRALVNKRRIAIRENSLLQVLASLRPHVEPPSRSCYALVTIGMRARHGYAMRHVRRPPRWGRGSTSAAPAHRCATGQQVSRSTGQLHPFFALTEPPQSRECRPS